MSIYNTLPQLTPVAPEVTITSWGQDQVLSLEESQTTKSITRVKKFSEAATEILSSLGINPISDPDLFSGLYLQLINNMQQGYSQY